MHRFFLLTLCICVTLNSFSQSRKYVMKRAALTTAPDKMTATAELIADTKKDFKPSEYEYFQSYSQSGLVLFNVNSVQAMKYLEEARELFKAHHKGYVKPFGMDIDYEFVGVLNSMRTIHLLTGKQESLIPVLETDHDFANTLSTQAKYDFHFLCAEIFMWAGRLDKAEASLAEARQLLDTKARFFDHSVYKDKRSLQSLADSEATMTKSMQLRYDAAIAALMAKRGNTAGADSLNNKVKNESAELRASTINERLQKKLDRRNSKVRSIFESFYGKPLELFSQEGGSDMFTNMYGKQPLPAQVPAGYLNSIPYYIRKNDHAKAQQLIADARAKLKDSERRPVDAIINEGFYSLIDDLEAIHFLSQGKYGKIIETRQKRLKTLDASLGDGLHYLSEKDLQSFFQKYQSVLSGYLAALSLTEVPSDIIKLFEKSAETRGLLLSVSKERGSIARQANTTTSKEIALLKRYHERANVLSQQAHLTGDETDVDSLLYYENLINQLQRKLQESNGKSTRQLTHITWKEVQQALKPGECFAFIQPLSREYFDPEYANATSANSEYWLIFFDHQSTAPKMVKIEDEIKLQRGLRYYQNSIKGVTDDALSYDLFWKPVANLSTGYKRIYFSPDGVYHLLNPYTLRNPKTQQFVIDEIEIVRIGNLSSFVNKAIATNNAQSNNPAFIGNPDFSMNRLGETSRKSRVIQEDFVFTDSVTRGGLSSLPGAEQEVKDVAAQANTLGLQVTLLTGEKATEFNVKQLVNPEILHFATHGIFVSGNSYDAFLRSKLALAGVNDGNTFTGSDHTKFEDGWLTAYEVTQLRLQGTRLVVLSACETAVGDVEASEGVYGIQRAFETAGARQVLGSLWKINDRATATLMTAFYDSYFKERDILKAYRTAMFATRRVFSHPYYWGSFVLNGTQ